MTTPRFLHRQRGATLIDALIAMLVLSIGMAGVAKLQSWMRLADDAARSKVQAVRLAQSSLELLRSGQHATSEPSAGFTVEQKLVQSESTIALEDSKLTVHWNGRTGELHTIRLATLHLLVSPLYSAALSLPPAESIATGRRVLPWGATMMDARRSIVRASASSGTAWQVDNASGMISARCSVNTGPASTALGLSDLRDCQPAAGSLLAGYVRFSTGPQPDAVAPNDQPFEAQVLLSVDSAGLDPKLGPELNPKCEVDRVQSSQGNYLSYVCVVQHDVSTAWSGSVQLVPVGWTLGSTAADHKVCRYVADLDASGRIDQNAEHPARYENVRGPLRQQNYLVIRGSAECPAAQSPQNAILASTTQHQP